jgi:hypothetical protein
MHLIVKPVFACKIPCHWQDIVAGSQAQTVLLHLLGQELHVHFSCRAGGTEEKSVAGLGVLLYNCFILVELFGPLGCIFDRVVIQFGNLFFIFRRQFPELEMVQLPK